MCSQFIAPKLFNLISLRLLFQETIHSLQSLFHPTPWQKGATVLVRKRRQRCITEAIGKRTCEGSGKRIGEEGERGGGSRAREGEKDEQRE
ncbi:hypothetical protein BHE74_00030934 [Ensete ventricosum]|nr:hypothetical protein BHE74_00030934 [Ensete ventricosum]